MEEAYLWLTTEDPLHVVDILRGKLNVPYLHLRGREDPGKSNTYLMLKKIPLESVEKFKRDDFTTEFGISKDFDKVLIGCRKRINPDQFDVYMPNGQE